VKTQIYESYTAFLNRSDKSENGVSGEFAAEYPDFKKRNATNKGCWNCSDCRGCSDCSDCSDCRGCRGERQNEIIIPVVENIHQKVLEMVQKEGAFNMSTWCQTADNACGMTYCRGGAVVLLAGEAGKKLKDQTSNEFAAMAIYSKSSPIKVSPVRFYEDNEKAMADIKRCAIEESKLSLTH
jgi:hypothetical protein